MLRSRRQKSALFQKIDEFQMSHKRRAVRRRAVVSILNSTTQMRRTGVCVCVSLELRNAKSFTSHRLILCTGGGQVGNVEDAESEDKLARVYSRLLLHTCRITAVGYVKIFGAVVEKLKRESLALLEIRLELISYYQFEGSGKDAIMPHCYA